MRILMISDVYFPRINGVSTSIQTFRRGLHAAGHETVLIAPEYPLEYSDAGQEPVIRVPSRYLPRDPEDRILRQNALRSLRPELKRGGFDLVHIQTPFIAHYYGVSVARELGVPVIETYHTYFEEYLHHYVPLIPRSVMRFVARRFTVSQCSALDALVVPSMAMQKALQDYGVRCPMHIIPTGMEMERFASGDGRRFRERVGIAADRPTLVHVGRIAHEKNIDFLLRMFVRVVKRKPETMLVVAGEGPALEHCKSYVESLKLSANVRFVGYLSRERELPDCYNAGDLFVFSSKTETQGLVLLEAMACGTPVVSTAYMGTADIVKPERGARVAPDDEAGFANLVVELLNDPERRRTMSTEARAYAATWSAGATAARMAELYSSLITADPKKLAA
ncbi:1,2-diacylglycerol 3-glucosyltransferase [Steroidobacter agaridevorans]|uniref:1,2-diacylglycerol 3-glucosyltransferase n=1 Tax=Steroidobacter agaridevorans TaxID=2695856 RepID=A0A829YDJ6_9GAMM|nr:glycosyltransferase [Steroidobacter agaridevorans]GFE81349.1 1,2-diacylglycerol 3-glucosyltransferase [Steroidobacter agaridevorans]GFE88769.1 1,2-diacylglycerol 3-glucosyltransferase [Steroidobacter agaridevorans]